MSLLNTDLSKMVGENWQLTKITKINNLTSTILSTARLSLNKSRGISTGFMAHIYRHWYLKKACKTDRNELIEIKATLKKTFIYTIMKING